MNSTEDPNFQLPGVLAPKGNRPEQPRQRSAFSEAVKFVRFENWWWIQWKKQGLGGDGGARVNWGEKKWEEKKRWEEEKGWEGRRDAASRAA